MKTSLSLRSFRFVCELSDIPKAEAFLASQGFRFIDEPFSPYARRLVEEPFPLGSSYAARFGYIYIQDKSSMLPPVALNPSLGAEVLDMCASPGSKTGFLGQLVGKNGFVLGNEPSNNRLATLRRNLAHLNLFQCATTSYSGDELPLPFESAWRYIQLDPPCSGWGTVEKNPQVLALWQGDKIKPLITLQRKLLAHAFKMLQPGGRLVYSTCTTNPDENERQLAYACDDIGYIFSPLDPLPGIATKESQDSRFDGCLHIETSEEAQGFFVAALTKPAEQSFLPREEQAEELKETSAKADRAILAHQAVRAGRKKQPSWREAPRLSREALAGDFCDPTLLPAGDIALFNDMAHFLPHGASALLPDAMRWKGFLLGKVVGAGGIKALPHLRGCMPSLVEAERSGLPLLHAEDAGVLDALLTGQSIPVNTRHGLMGLYFQELPLCVLTVKGSRALLPPL